ncbi:BA75_03172T0 [Komagataella pastoris]|uniref:BA75_03172T0 n=1 Tax=Komagataella pastoris TaxID=4922 RepID=A0A1B2JB95_PICPA|nr:BA75_03172T0 [Komagataella pastoris]
MFGHKFKDEHFSFGKNVVQVNNGSFGSVPTTVLQKYKEAIDLDHEFSDRYLLTELPGVIKNAAAQVAEFVNSDANNIVFTLNATTSVNTVLRSYPFAKGDKIAMFDIAYGACANTIRFLSNRQGIEVVTIELKLPLEDDEIVEKFEATLKEEKPKLALFDVIVSMPGVRLPFERLIEVCRKYNVLSLVDGAHAIGIIPLDLKKWRPDFFLSNLHKWLYVPKGCSFLYVDPKHHRNIHTFPVSHSYLDDEEVLSEELERTRLVDRFAFYGTFSYAGIDCIPAALEFRKTVCGGEEKINGYCFELAKDAANHIAKQWNTSVLENAKGTISTTMSNVEVPINDQVLQFLKNDKKNIVKLRKTIDPIMLKEYSTLLPSIFHNGKLWVRFSAQVYNELSDYEYASDTFLKLLGENEARILSL